MRAVRTVKIVVVRAARSKVTYTHKEVHLYTTIRQGSGGGRHSVRVGQVNGGHAHLDDRIVPLKNVFTYFLDSSS